LSSPLLAAAVRRSRGRIELCKASGEHEACIQGQARGASAIELAGSPNPSR
jgi:hypothetical protein